MTGQNAENERRHPRPKCGHSPGHEAGDCVPTLDSWAAAHLDDWLYLRDHRLSIPAGQAGAE